MGKSQKKTLVRLIVGSCFFALAILLPAERLFHAQAAPYVLPALFLIPYLIIGGDVLLRAITNIAHGQVFDENFLMCVATAGALALGDYKEAVAVMLFYQVGELFQRIAVNRSRQSIAALMDIRPDYANVERDGKTVRLDPEEVAVGDVIVVRPGERVPLDGVITEGATQLDTAALTGESLPREATCGDEAVSGSVALSGLIRVQVTKPYGESTVARILELVENAGDKKARVESFITRFARWYTPAVCALALLLAVVPPLFMGGGWPVWIERGLIFLVVSCPCALVISVPLSFFGGIGGASRRGVLIKGSNYMEVLAKADTVVFDKTGTLTNGGFTVVAVHPQSMPEARLLELAAHAEAFSTHPIAQSVIRAYGKPLNNARVSGVEERSGQGIKASVDGLNVLAGNDALMTDNDIGFHACHLTGTIIHIAIDAQYEGHIVISDTLKPDAAKAIADLHALGVRKTVMLTGDREEVAAEAAKALGIGQFHAGLLPQDKVALVEQFLLETPRGTTLAFVGDGINDAPVLTRADVGIAMGAMGSDAAIEAADVVLMDDKPTNIAVAMRMARKTLSIVKQNIWLALGVKALTLLLAALGIASMWWAVFADVGVAVIAILNAMRAMRSD